MSDLDRLAADLIRAATQTTNQGRGVTADHVDVAAKAAKTSALSRWTKYGRGEAGSAGTMRGRMSSDSSQVVGYVLADGQGAFQAEHGTTSRAPDPVMMQAAEGVADAWAEDLADMAERLLS